MKRLLTVAAALTAVGLLLAACSSETVPADATQSSGGFSTQVEVANDTKIADEGASQQAEAQEEDAQPESKASGSKSAAAAGASSKSANTSSAGSSSKAPQGTSSAAASSKASASSRTDSAPPSGKKPSAGASSSKAAPPKQTIGTIGSFTMTNLSGGTVNQSILNGYDLTMINVWATYCNPCITEIPDIDGVYRELKGTGVNIIGVALDGPGNVSGIQSVVNKTGASYGMYIPSASMLQNSFMSNVTFVPTTFFADRNGNLVGSPVSGSRSASAWKKIINERLAQARS